MAYSHTQRGPIWLLLLFFGLAEIAAAIILRHETVAASILGGCGLLFLFLAASFKTLTITDGGDALALRFGPIPLLQKRIPYTGISEVTTGESALIDGWGIHYIPGRGWTYNLSGFTCVQLTVNGKTVRVGTDDAESLAAFIRSRIGSDATPA